MDILFKSLIALFLFVLVSCNPENITTTTDKLPSNVINKIVIDKQGVKWIATDKGVVSFDGKTWKEYSNIPTLYRKPVYDLAINNNTTANQIWFGSNEGITNGIATMQQLSSNSSIRYEASKLLNDTVFSLSVTDNLKYFGTRNGLSILKDSNTWTSYDGQWGRSKDNFLVSKKITGIAIAKNGWNYVSTKGGGVSRFKYADAVSGATKFFQPWAYGLKSDTVFTVVIVNDTCQWYGTDKGAAYHTSHSTKSDWTSYSTEDGLASDTVYAIAQDNLGNTWFGTQRGVSKFANNVFTNYTIKDGLVSNKVNCVAIDTDGSVWFGTNAGISHLKGGVWKSYNIN